MVDQIHVFICHKKLLSWQLDGQSVVQENGKAELFHHLLSQSSKYHPWIDHSRLLAGMEWEHEIYSQLRSSDVVAVLIGPGTSESEWVRREITLAQALDISIVPIGFDLSREQMVREMAKLGISNLQGIITSNIDFNRGPALLAEIDGALTRAAATTRTRQEQMLRDRLARLNPARAKAPDNQRAASFHLFPGDPPVTLHVASGDISRVRNVDVFVNSENDYMQMARFFEVRTVSALLRRRGSYTKDNTYHDAIQQELDWQLRNRSRPVQASEAFPTSAGGPHSVLARINKARAIIHVAAVQAVDAECRVVPYKEPDQIEASVRSVLSVMAELNRKSGVFSPEGTDQRAEQERFAGLNKGNLTSIIFPLLGTGQAGAQTHEVIGPMINGLLDFLTDEDNQELAKILRDIYISAYTQEDVEITIAALSKKFNRIL